MTNTDTQTQTPLDALAGRKAQATIDASHRVFDAANIHGQNSAEHIEAKKFLAYARGQYEAIDEARRILRGEQ